MLDAQLRFLTEYDWDEKILNTQEVITSIARKTIDQSVSLFSSLAYHPRYLSGGVLWKRANDGSAPVAVMYDFELLVLGSYWNDVGQFFVIVPDSMHVRINGAKSPISPLN